MDLRGNVYERQKKEQWRCTKEDTLNVKPALETRSKVAGPYRQANVFFLNVVILFRF